MIILTCCLTVQVHDENLACLKVCNHNGIIQMSVINTHCVEKMYTYLHDIIGIDKTEYHVTLVYTFYEVSFNIYKLSCKFRSNTSVS